MIASKEKDFDSECQLNLFEVKEEQSSFDESLSSYKTYQGKAKLFVNKHERDYPSQTFNY